MKKTYLILVAILILLSLGLFVLEARENNDKVTPMELLTDLIENTRYVTSDELASRIIERDPSIQLIDVRDPYDFMDFSLPGAENIPISDLSTEMTSELLSVPGKDFIFYSNGDVEANKAWMISQRLGYSRLYILKGGLNNWIKTIIKPQPPAESQALNAFDLYEFRLGASQYFTGGSAKIATDTPAQEIKFERKKKKAAVEGGC